MNSNTALLLLPVWAVAVWALLATRDWPAIRSAIRQHPVSTLAGYSLPALALLVICPIWFLLS